MKGENAVAGLQEIGGIGDVVAEAIKDFFDEPHNRQAREQSAQRGRGCPACRAYKTVGSPVVGKTVVFTGTLEKMTRQESQGARGVRFWCEGLEAPSLRRQTSSSQARAHRLEADFDRRNTA